MESEKITPARLHGHITIFLAAVMWGAMSPIAKHIMLSGAIPSLALSAIRIAGGAAVFWIAGLFLPEKIAGRGNIALRDMPLILLMSVLIISANQGLYILGIGFTTPFEATVMTTMTPVFTLLLAAVFIGMPVTFMKCAGVVLGLGGALMLAFISRDGSDTLATDPALGNLLCLGAQICAAVYYTMFGGIIRRYHPFVLLKWLFLCGCITWIPFTWSSLSQIEPSLVDSSIVWGIVYIIIFPTFLSYLFMVWSQQRLKPTTVSMYSYIQPLTAALIASLMGLAAFGWLNIIATLMIFIGVGMVAVSPGKSD